MADPFEVRLRFTNMLTHLSASTTSSLKTASFAIKHRDMDEDLHSCILESLEASSTSMNSRANIMYFLEYFCDVATKPDGHSPYVEMVRRDIIRIIGGVAGKGSGMGANVKVVRKVVDNLKTKGVLEETEVTKIDRDLKDREDKHRQGTGDHEQREKERHGRDREREKERAARKEKEARKYDKRAIEQRIEEDRERNKRLRENVWAVNGNDEDELNRMWEETSDLNDDDYAIAQEEADERAQFARYHRNLLLEPSR